MNRRDSCMSYYRSVSILMVCLLLITGCGMGKKKTHDLPEIEQRGELIAITSYNPLSYFVYRGEVMGYEYELLKMLEQHLGLKVRIVLARDFEKMMDMLNSGQGDVIAYGLTVTSQRRERVAFTNALNMTRQVLVQRKPEDWRQMPLHRIERKLIRNPVDLSGKTIHVRRGSAYVHRLENLSREIGIEINIIEAAEGVVTEELIRKVSEGEIDYTVSDENIAQIKSSFYRNLDVSTPVSLPQQTAWAVRHTSPKLLEAINNWLEDARKEADFFVIYNKYFENRRAFRSRYSSPYFPKTGGSISPYDELLQKYAKIPDWDWRLLAALIYQESQFDPNARSWAGALGLMQLMPETAERVGVDNPFDPESNIAGGTGYLKWLHDYWEEYIQDASERLKFVIASYNAGHGHVQDARRLAKAHDADPDIWHGHVEKYMLKKSNPDYYNRQEVRYGYASGIEPVTYVDSILSLYTHYKQFVE